MPINSSICCKKGEIASLWRMLIWNLCCSESLNFIAELWIMKNINVSMRFMLIFFHDGRRLRVCGECLEDRLYILKAKTSICPYLFWQGNWSPYALLDYENVKELMLLEYLRYYEFYEFDLVHLYQEKEVFLWLTQREHIQIPKYPFFNCSNHQSWDTQELYTNE